MKKQISKQQKYSALERKAYWMGVGCGATGGEPNKLIDDRFGAQQDEKLFKSARAGYAFGSQTIYRYGAPFDRRVSARDGLCCFVFGDKYGELNGFKITKKRNSANAYNAKHGIKKKNKR